jgi:hypothetical protein
MRDAKEHLGSLDLLDVPDVWTKARSRLPSSPADFTDMAPRGRQRVLAAIVAIGVSSVAAVFLAQAFSGPVDRPDTSPSMSAEEEIRGVWQPLPAPPIPFRQGAIGFWVDGRVVIIGGSETAPTCPRYANCAGPEGPAPRDGAAYEPSTGTWTRIAASPLPIIPYTGTVVRDVVYVWGSADGSTETSLLALDVNEDRWSEFPLPPGPHRPTALRLTAAGQMVVAFADSHERGVSPDALFDPSSGKWRVLPRDPLIPSFDRSIVWTGAELVLLGIEVLPPEDASYRYRAAVLDLASETWRRLPATGIVGYSPTWFWAAGRVVNPWIGHVGDNGSVEGTGPPYGGMLVPSTGDWSELPRPPKHPSPYGGPTVGGDRYVVTEQGAILDVATRSWEVLPAPPVAADEQAVAVWAGDRLFVWGGYRWNLSEDEAEMVKAGWSWTPSG